MSIRAETRKKFMDALIAVGASEIEKNQIQKICNELKINIPSWFINDPNNRIRRGLYRVPQFDATVNMQKHSVVAFPAEKEMTKTKNKIANVVTSIDEMDLIPEVNKNYVPFGNYNNIKQIIESGHFFPVFISGHSGNGKTLSVEQACAQLKRKFICVSMTPETDESDLLGNYVLIDGQMEWRDGPVTTAARQGAVLCIDEIDYGAQNLSCLQRVLEGRPFLLKKKGEMIFPDPGFTIFATANTKGKGSEDGRYMFTNVLNEAFLERFRITMEQNWPDSNIEKKILKKELNSLNYPDNEFADKLVTWAEVIRKTFEDGGCDELISTRRLVHIIHSYSIFKNKITAIELCVNRFDADTKSSFLDLYSKIDAGVSNNQTSTVSTAATESVSPVMGASNFIKI